MIYCISGRCKSIGVCPSCVHSLLVDGAIIPYVFTALADQVLHRPSLAQALLLRKPLLSLAMYHLAGQILRQVVLNLWPMYYLGIVQTLLALHMALLF